MFPQSYYLFVGHGYLGKIMQSNLILECTGRKEKNTETWGELYVPIYKQDRMILQKALLP